MHLTGWQPTTKKITILWVITALACIVLYQPFGLYFLNDDFIHIPLSEKAVFGQRHSIRVVNDFSLYLDSLLYGKSAAGFHFTNLMLHMTNTVLVFFSSRRLLGLFDLPNGRLVGHAAALFFAVYPFHSESVFWIIGRTGALSSLWMQMAFLAYCRSSPWWKLTGTLLFLTGLFTYESVLCLPFLLAAIWLYRKWNYHGSQTHWLQCLLFSVTAIAAYILARLVILGQVTDKYESGNLMKGNLSTLVSKFAALALRLFVPPFVSTKLFFIAAIFIISSILLMLFHYRRKWIKDWMKHALIVAILLSSLLPYISLGIDTHGFESERYLYVPSVFLAALAAVVLQLGNTKQRWIFSMAYLVFAIACLLRSSLSFRRASAFAEQIVQTTAINLQPSYRNIIFINMPGEHNGVMLLRMGLPEAIEWLVPASDGMIISSVQPNMDPFLSLSAPQKPVLISRDKLAAKLPDINLPSANNALIIALINQQVMVSH